MTTGAESNLLKFKELTGYLSEEEDKRWKEIKRGFKRNNLLQGVGSDDKFGQAIVQLSAFNEKLEGIKDTIDTGMSKSESNLSVRYDGLTESFSELHSSPSVYCDCDG